MFPTFSIFGYEIGMYSVCAIIGMVVAVIYEYFALKDRKDIDRVQVVNVAVVAGLGVFLGAHLLFAVTKWRDLFSAISDYRQTFSSFQNAMKVFLGIFGGMVFYGGLLGGIVAGVWYIRRLKHIRLDPVVYADAYAPAIPLFHVFGRIGCFLGGCCYGMECRWGFVYHDAPIPESNGVVRLPIQLIESAANLLLFFILHRMSKKKPFRGKLICSYLIMYAPMRFVLEFFRGDVARGFLFQLSTSQWISILILIAAVISLFVFRKKEREQADLQ
ncbi:MAG: prolipoprotein diacylglyceryl transferase [Lachnospiraceae bacterium]|nr:prolipoprotein diacylglyceryl transferase [Lachnospiraceae bacterium]